MYSYPVRIAIDASLLAGRYTGDRTYWRCLIDALPRDTGHTYILYTREPLPIAPDPSIEIRRVPGRNHRWWSMVTLPFAARKDRADLLHVQYTVSPLTTLPAVTTVHDVTFLLHPEWYRPKDRLLLRHSVPASMRRAARVIAVSETSKRDMVRTTGLPEAKITVTLLAAPPEFAPVSGATEHVKNRFGLEEPYLFALGTLQPRKNLPMLARAYEASGASCTLAIAGKEGWGEQPGGSLLGYVADEDLPSLYSAACAFLFPSLYEGFGIPVLEAMACGCPVICSDGGALPEVAGDAAMILPTGDERPWTEVIRSACSGKIDLTGLREKGLLRAKMHDWRDTARRTVRVYEEVIT